MEEIIVRDKKLRKEIRKLFKQFERVRGMSEALVDALSGIVYLCYIKALGIYQTIKQTYPEESREADFEQIFEKVYGLTLAYLNSIWSEEEEKTPKLNSKPKTEGRYIG